jgi:hypothetical protein
VSANLSTTIKQHVTAFIESFKFGALKRAARPDSQVRPFKIAGYTLVLMDDEGQVVFSKEWDAGGVFDFGPHQSLWVHCEFSNQTRSSVQVTEYEIELRGEDGAVIKTFNGSFGSVITVAPGENRVFPARWQL